MKYLSFLFLSSFLTVTVFGANVTGKVSFTGKKPKEEFIKMTPDCAKEAGKKVAKEDVVVSNNTLANVFVFVKTGAKGGAPATEPVVFDQKGCMYSPRVFGVMVNQPIKIVNSDPLMHNVHALPKSNPGFNMGMATKGQSVERKFSKPEQMVRIKCDVHGWMTAYAGVMDHPYFAVSDSNGAFTIKDLPPGDYTLEAWHEKLGTKTQAVKVADSGATADFTFASPAL